MTFILNELMTVGDSLSLSIDTILSGIENIVDRPLDFNLAAHARDMTSISSDEWSDAASGGVKIPGTMGFTGDVELDYQFLQLDETAFVLDGIDWVIVTNVGIIDGKLHLQTRQTDAYNSNYNYGLFNLLDSDGNRISSIFDISMNGYREAAFEIPNGLSEYRLAVSGMEIENVVHGPCNMSFVIESELQKKSLKDTLTQSPYFDRIEVTCSPISTTVMFYYEEFFGDDTASEILKEIVDYYKSFTEPYLTLTDGSTIQLELSSSMFDNGGIGSVEFDSVYFDISELNSITVCGEEYFFE